MRLLLSLIILFLACSVAHADVILVDTTGGAVTLTLPDATYGARELTIRRKAGTASITVTPYGTQKINGASSLTISDDLATPLQSDWSNWWTLR